MSVEDVEREEALEEAGEEISKDERRRSVLLWFGVLGSPLAWVGHLGVNYSLEEWFACSESARDKGEILGVGVKTISVVFNSAMLAVAVASGLVALGCWRKLQAQEGDENGDDRMERARWMAFAGSVEAALFVGIILLGYLPSLMLDVCETTP
ncbi:MAG TPA: hypothetical protein VHF27_01640 [Acidimicrobiales bacterium]|nr:hypothetical protein [Acidimicrobiales bacterium]